NESILFASHPVYLATHVQLLVFITSEVVVGQDCLSHFNCMAATLSFTGRPKENAFDELAPQSSSASALKPLCDVFINHRGTDVKHTLAKAIYDILIFKGLNVCLDVWWLETGDEIPSELQAAMSSASVHIAIFSENYVQSPWCLAELSYMRKTSGKIIPVFYGVKPCDLRWVAEGKGKYVDAVVKHVLKGRYSFERLVEWNRALHEISFVKGYEVKNNDDEGELLNNILNDVLKIRNHSLRRLRYHNTAAVGIDDKISEVMKLLQCDIDKPAVAVVVHGIGGAGKTTLADAVYANLNLHGWKHSKVTLIKNMESHPKIEKLQSQILQDLTGQKQYTVRDCQSGQQELSSIIKNEAVFIYIDNIQKIEHLENLLPKEITSQRKVRILATARKTNASVMFESRGVEPYNFLIESLSDESALTLLCKHIDREREKNSIVDGRPQATVIAQKCSCCPLFLEVVGRYLRKRGNEVAAYERVLDWLRGGEDFSCDREDLFNESRILFAYDELGLSAQEAFLDICCFFSDREWDEVVCIVGKEELDCLQEGALVKRIEVEENCIYGRSKRKVWRISIHDLIVTAGRNKSKGNRFRTAHDFSIALENEELIRQTKGVWLEYNYKPFDVSAEILDAMSNSLRVFAMGDMTIVSGRCSKQFDKLSLKKKAIWSPPENFSGLQVLKLHDWHINTGIEFGHLHKVKHLDLDRFHINNISSPLKVYGLQKLEMLQKLKFSRIKGLKELPASMGKLQSLQELHLIYCEEVEQLPASFGKLQSLLELYLVRCGKLKQLPAGFGELRSLTKLDLAFCSSLQELPCDFKKLVALQSLDLSHCSRLQELPCDFERLLALQSLHLSNCSSLLRLPEGLGNLPSLTYINVHGCRKLITLPDRVTEMSLLNGRISFFMCSSLKEIPEDICKLTMLTSLSFEGCNSLKVLPIGFSQLTFLEELVLKECESLEELCNDFYSLLNLSNCQSLDGKWMDSVGDIKSLWYLDIAGSEMMIQRWREMERETEEWHFVVISDSALKESTEGKSVLLLKGMISKIFDEDGLLTDIHQRPFHSSFLLSHTPLVLIIHDEVSEMDGELFEKNVQQLEWSSKAWQIIYVGRHFNALPYEVKDRILVYTSSNKFSLFIDKFRSAFPSVNRHINAAFRSRDGLEEKGMKYPSSWEDISYIFNDLAFLVRTPRESNFEILRAVLQTDFLHNNSRKVQLTDLQGKVILLLYGSRTMFEHCYLSFEDVYAKMQDSHRHLVEVVWIPHWDWIPRWDRNRQSDQLKKDIADVPWPVVPNPWLIRKTSSDFLVLLSRSVTYPTVVVVDGKGRISNKNAFQMIERWGTEAYPFSQTQKEELIKSEWVKASNYNSFVFQNLNLTHTK
ncbi:hypothetical protein KI387_034508, partial [Taxus chinensis]